MVGVNATSYTNSGLSAATTYYYKVYAYNSAGDSSASNIANATTQCNIPPPPVNLSCTAISSSQINLNWGDNSNNEDGFKIERAFSSSGPWSQIATVGSNVIFYPNTNLSPSTTYFYRIRAYNSTCNSSYSNIVNDTTLNDSFCGDGNLDPAEECDDGNNIPGDGCSATCTIEDGSSNSWSWSFGDTHNDGGHSVAIDGSGNVLMTGYFYGIVDFGGGPLESIHLPWIEPIMTSDAVLAKYSPAGDHLWSMNLGGTSNEQGMAVATDAANNVIVAGTRSSYDVNYDGGVDIGLGYTDVFLAKFSPTGEYLWSGIYGGVNSESVTAVAVDGNGDVLLVGDFTHSVNFGGPSFSSSGFLDIVVAKYSGVDGHHLWSKRLGGTNVDQPSGIAVDSSNNVFVTGKFAGVTDVGGGPLTSAGGYDAFVAKFSPSGTHMWSKRLGGPGQDNAPAIAIDSSNHVILTGAFQQTVNFGGGPLTSAGSGDIFIATYQGANGTHLWSQRYGGPNDERSKGVAVDGNDNVIVTGSFIGPVSFGGEEVSSMGTYDTFVAKYSASGTYIWSEVYSGPNGQMPKSVAVNGNSNIAITGLFITSINFGGENHISNGNADIFLLSIEP
jgi:cysteine-rich repeat protein